MTTAAMTLAELAERIRAASYLEGDFTLRSGGKIHYSIRVPD